MNSTAIDAFEAYLDQALAALQLRAGRKKQMREELLAHLLGIFDEERERLGDDRSAVDATLRRFGAAPELATNLHSCVTFQERFLSSLLGFKETIMWRLFMILGVIFVLVGAAFVMPAVQQMLYVEVLPLSVALLILGIVLALGGIGSFAHGVRRYRVS